MKFKYILYIAILGFLFSCKPELEDYAVSSGNAEFSTYVALGNSLTAGYANGALYRSGQMYSYPSILADQFKKAGGGEFVQPLMDGEYGIFPGKLKLGYATDCLGTTNLAPVPDQGNLDPLAPVGYTVNNLGVPGAKSFHLVAPGYGNLAGVPVGTANPYYARFASSEVATVVGDAIAQTPTFYTLWIGSNDVLGYATSGGLGDTITGQNTFAYILNTILMSMNATGAKGAIANIPDIVSAPFFNTVPPNGYVLTQGQADTLNLFLGGFGFQYQAGPNYFIVEDPTSQLGFRQMVAGELLLLTVPQDSLKCAYWGGFNPLLQQPVPIPSQYVLSTTEINNINAAVEGYNATISQLASQYGLALVDANAVTKELGNGLIYNGETISSTFVTGNGFSLDGIHLTPKGYALVANLFIEAINQQYGATLPLVNLVDYPANELP
jgi:lysophospholipase L1-like esterase